MVIINLPVKNFYWFVFMCSKLKNPPNLGLFLDLLRQLRDDNAVF